MKMYKPNWMSEGSLWLCVCAAAPILLAFLLFFFYDHHHHSHEAEGPAEDPKKCHLKSVWFKFAFIWLLWTLALDLQSAETSARGAVCHICHSSSYRKTKHRHNISKSIFCHFLDSRKKKLNREGSHFSLLECSRLKNKTNRGCTIFSHCRQVSTKLQTQLQGHLFSESQVSKKEWKE